jgi:hypothetical protein
MTISAEVKESLEREFNICSKAIKFYKRHIEAMEKKYRMSTSAFLKKFEKGEMGDEQDFSIGMPFISFFQTEQAPRMLSSLLFNDLDIY